MGIQNFPVALQAIIQQGYLEREFHEAIQPELTFRQVAERTEFPGQIGETITRTRTGLKAPVSTPLNPSTNTNLDNGLSPAGWTAEQYSLAINMYGDTIDLNMVTTRVGIEEQFTTNAKVNGVQAGQSVDRLARAALYTAYHGGNTFVSITSTTTSIAVPNINGFDKVFSNGVMVPVSNANPLAVLLNGNAYSVVGAVADVTNTSYSASFGGRSGVLTLSTAASGGDGTAGNPLVSSVAPAVIRPNARASSFALQSGDFLKMAQLEDAVTVLRNQKAPLINGKYNIYLDPTSMRQLYADTDFQTLYRGAYGSSEYKQFDITEFLDMRFIRTVEAPQGTNGTRLVHRPLVCAGGALVEGWFEYTGYSDIPDMDNAWTSVTGGIAQVVRPPLDRLGQIIAQSWYYIGGFVVPTDITSNPTIIPTTSNAAFKRAVVIEHS